MVLACLSVDARHDLIIELACLWLKYVNSSMFLEGYKHVPKLDALTNCLLICSMMMRVKPAWQPLCSAGCYNIRVLPGIKKPTYLKMLQASNDGGGLFVENGMTGTLPIVIGCTFINNTVMFKPGLRFRLYML